jgi:probable rRNA maturation factor
VNSKIQFFSEGVNFRLKEKVRHRQWLISVILEEKKKPWYINFIFCDDNYLLDLNRNFLKHDTLTDVITFPAENVKENISGDIFISIDRVTENAGKFGVPVEEELRRVMVHGVLHLAGYSDKTRAEKNRIRTCEDHHLSTFLSVSKTLKINT